MIRVPPGQIENPQQVTAVVAGPDDANRLLSLDGQFPAGIGASGGTVKETFSVLLGPVLTRRQFVQAAASASLTGFSMSGAKVVGWSVDSVDADWDDESGQVELRVEISVSAGVNANATVTKVGYHVTVLAEM